MKNCGNFPEADSMNLIRRFTCRNYVSKCFTKNATIDEMRDAAARICRDYLTGQWKSITADKIVVKRISGGLSNFLYYVSLPNIESTSFEGENNFAPTANTNIDTTTKDPLTPITTTTTNNLNNITCDKIGNNKNHNIVNNNLCNNNELLNKSTRCMGSLKSATNGNKRQRTDSGLGAADEPREVLLRIYGQTHGENALETMISESVVFALLSERNFGPKLHGIFPGGRVEQFIPARPLVTTELSDAKLSMKIAEKMGEIHSLNLPMSKEPDWLWNCMERWLKGIDSVLKAANIDKHKLDEIKSIDFWEEAKWLKSIIDKNDCPVLFCHNDMQEGNILLRGCGRDEIANSLNGSLDSLRSNFEDSSITSNDDSRNENVVTENNDLVVTGSRRKRANSPEDDHSDLESTRDSVISNESLADSEPDLIIIDFEYCAYNYRGFDLANHFLEWMIDYSNSKYPYFYYLKYQYPSKQQRVDFITTYLKKLHESVSNYSPTEDEIESVEKEVLIFSMFSHLFWSLWSVVNINSNIEFGYVHYAIIRIQEYKDLKYQYIYSFE